MHSTQEHPPPPTAKAEPPHFVPWDRPSPPDHQGEPLLAPDADPEDAVEKILALLGQDLYLPARRLAAAAAARFPDHDRVQWAWDIFETRGKARPGRGGPEPATDEEFAWLRDPPQWAVGKWVALVGREVVAAADTLAEVAADVRSQKLPKRPLVHHIAKP